MNDKLRELVEQLCDCEGTRLNGRARELANEIRAALAEKRGDENILREVCEILGVKLGPGLARYAPLIQRARELVHAERPQLSEEQMRALMEKLNADAEAWDNKNDELDEPKSTKDENGNVVVPNDYAYGYNAGVSQGFYSAAAKLKTAALLTGVAEKVPLVEAVRRLYYAAHWHADRHVDEKKLWEDVRDAAGFEKGNAPAAPPVLQAEPSDEDLERAQVIVDRLPTALRGATIYIRRDRLIAEISVGLAAIRREAERAAFEKAAQHYPSTGRDAGGASIYVCRCGWHGPSWFDHIRALADSPVSDGGEK